MELVSCVKAVLRRCAPKQVELSSSQPAPSILTSIPSPQTAERVALTFKEFELLLPVPLPPRYRLHRDQLMEEIWGTDYLGESRTVDMHIRTLRQKLGKYGDMIETVRNVGYRLEVSQ